jgi:hypothetical protein
LSWTTLFYTLTGIVVLAMLPVLISESGLWARWFSSSKTGTAKSPSDSLPTPAQILPPTPSPDPTAAAKTPAVVVPASPKIGDASTTFHLARPGKADPWTYDGDRVVRVNRPEFCEVAATLTLLAVWGIEVNLQDFRRLTVEDVQRLDLVQANHDLGLRSVDIKGDLARILIYDLPVVVEIADPDKRLSGHVVLLRVTPTVCRIADPMMGIQEVPRPLFESYWRKAIGIYLDPDNLESLARGQKSESVHVLQQALSDLSYYRGPLTGEFDRATVSAVEYLQRYFEMFPTGRLDPLTIMLVTSHRNPDRPRLTPPKEQVP